MYRSGKSEEIIEDVAGCGKFQVIVSICVYFLACTSQAFTMLFMSFGNFDPGRTCVLKNSPDFINGTIVTSHNVIYNTELSNTSAVAHKTTSDIDIITPANFDGSKSIKHNMTGEYVVRDACQVFEYCENLEFDPGSSTIVSEWGLVCGRKWIPSFIIFVEMVGVFIGSSISGYVSDAIGRKPTTYGALCLLAVFNLLSIFSSSWQMFGCFSFLAGVFSSFVVNLHYIYTSEFVPNKWRSVLQGIPAWNVSAIIFALTCSYHRNWRYIQLTAVVIGIVGLIPAFWIPESLRWLEVKNKIREFQKVAEKIIRTNGKPLSSMENLELSMTPKTVPTTKDVKRYNVFHLFSKEIRQYTILLTVPWFAVSFVFFAIGFVIKAMHGDFYINLIIYNALDIPFAILPIIFPNLLGRKLSALIFAAASGICLVGASCLDHFGPGSVKMTGISILIFTVKVVTNAMWCVIHLIATEIYPTVVRGLGTGWCLTVARAGGIVAPFIIPDDADSVFVSYLTMGLLLFLCCAFIAGLPETKGRPLQQSLEIDEERSIMCDMK